MDSHKQFLLAEVKATGEDGAEFESVLSAPTLDRDFEVIDTNAFAPLPDSIPVHAFHDFHDPVARGVPYYDGDVLKVKGTFASTPRAQEIRTLVREGIIGSMSVGFMPPTREKGEDGVDHITRAELLEGSFVSVPSNREAAILMAKDYREAAVKVGSRNNTDDAARLQAIHDLATENGAKCVTADEERGEAVARAFRWYHEHNPTRPPGYKEPTTTSGIKPESVHAYEVLSDGALRCNRCDTSSTKEVMAQLARRANELADELEPDVKTKGDEDSTGPAMAPVEQARLAIARLEADLLLNS